jgi:hypothetical protein
LRTGLRRKEEFLSCFMAAGLGEKGPVKIGSQLNFMRFSSRNNQWLLCLLLLRYINHIKLD